uniref:Apple domain-containing protein n=1 Tax=Globisporangium ultimum (strain ATCC 200006 / CBS 805.95 / DAOM BR144) TaxID=431595 RepID=K3WCW4_GLOUD
MCLQVTGCRAFSYASGLCYFKNRKDQTAAKAGVTSVTVLPNPAAPSCVLEVGVDYVANDIGSAYSATPTGCCSICMKVSGCKAFSWNTSGGGTCWLKSNKGATVLNSSVTSSVV